MHDASLAGLSVTEGSPSVDCTPSSSASTRVSVPALLAPLPGVALLSGYGQLSDDRRIYYPEAVPSFPVLLIPYGYPPAAFAPGLFGNPSAPIRPSYGDGRGAVSGAGHHEPPRREERRRSESEHGEYSIASSPPLPRPR